LTEGSQLCCDNININNISYQFSDKLGFNSLYAFPLWQNNVGGQLSENIATLIAAVSLQLAPRLTGDVPVFLRGG